LKRPFKVQTMAAACGSRYVESLEKQNKKLKQALENITGIMQSLVFEIPPKNKWNPIVSKIGKGERIYAEEYQILRKYLDLEIFDYNQQIEDAITSGLRSLATKHIKTKDNAPLVKAKIISLEDAMLHLEAISKLPSDEELQKYASGPLLEYMLKP